MDYDAKENRNCDSDETTLIKVIVNRHSYMHFTQLYFFIVLIHLVTYSGPLTKGLS